MTRTRGLVLAGVALVLLAGCTREPASSVADASPSAVATTAAASPTASHTASRPPAGSAADKQACDLNAAMQKRHDDLDYTGEGATIAKIQRLAGNSANLDIKAAANLLKDGYDLAKASGTAADLLELATASINLNVACIKAGLT